MIWTVKQTVNVSHFIFDYCKVSLFIYSLGNIEIDSTSVSILFANCKQKYESFNRQSAYLANKHVNRPVFETFRHVRTAVLCSFKSSVRMKGL